MRRFLARTLGAAVSGGALAVAFPPLGLWWAAPFGVAGLSLLAGGAGAAAGAWTGLVLGAAFFTPLLHFTAVALGNDIGWAALTVLESLYLLALGLAWSLVSRMPSLGLADGAASLRRRARSPRGGAALSGRGPGLGAAARRVAAFTVLWCGVEELRSSWPWGGFPFGRLAFAMADAPMLPVAAYGGSIGLTAVVALVGALAAEIVRAARAHRPLGVLVPVIAIGALVMAPVALPVDSRTEDGTIRVAAVQGNVAEDFEDAFGRAREVTGNHAEATEKLAEEVGAGTLDVVIWPENAADLDPRVDAATAALVEEAAQAVQAPVIVGAVPYANGARYNDMVVWTPGQGAGATYRKHRPVPFAEYIPLRSLLRRVTDQVDRIGTDMLPGTGSHTLDVVAATQGRTVRMAMGICFEVAYDDSLRAGVLEGGELIVIPTNNASFLHSSEAAQQLAQGRVQAVVHGRTVVQASTVGITAIISPHGVVEQETQPYTQAALVADVGLRTSVTVADRLGSWPGIALEVAALALVLAGTLSGMRRLARRVAARRR